MFANVAALVESGLHCGPATGRRVGEHRGVAPLVESGLHCGTTSAHGLTVTTSVAPLVESGLHCGFNIQLPSWAARVSPRSSRAGSIAATRWCRPDGALRGRPARRERAPLRPSPPGCWPGSGRRSPRSSRAGSIAATGTRVLQAGLPSRPARRERAPLRLCPYCIQKLEGTVAPLVESGLHCGPASPTRVLIPLAASPRSSRAGSIAAGQPPRLPRRGWRVAPLVESGLHCGPTTATTGSFMWSCRPARRERAPLRRYGAALVHPPARRRPARRERAPLRRIPPRTSVRCEPRRPARRERAPLRPPGGRKIRRSVMGRPARRERAPLRRLAERPTADAVTVAPLVESGLHCGIFVRTGPVQSRSCRPARRERAPLRRDEVGRGRLVPLRRPARRERAPLRHHCGVRAQRRRGARRPARRERAPVRRLAERPTADAVTGSPRSSRAGSIAARRRLRWSSCRCPSPRSSRAGSIAASRAARRSRSPRRVAPLVESGLHCGRVIRGLVAFNLFVAPLVESGLHCGLSLDSESWLIAKSPRSSRAGSIAAEQPPRPPRRG